jgi:NADP-dependent 3-hydroxy acid dehydrogenase YdfG
MTALHRVILVTGASAGIGRACAIGLSKAFPSATHPEPLVLALVGRREDELKATEEMCREGTVTEVLRGDVSSDEDVGRIFSTIKDKYGRLDVLFNVSYLLRTLADARTPASTLPRGARSRTTTWTSSARRSTSTSWARCCAPPRPSRS